MRLSYLFIGFALLTSACGPAQTPASPPGDAERVIREMRARYSNASSYRDRGRVHTTMTLGPDQVQTNDLEFETAFVRSSGAFYFEYRAADNAGKRRRAVLWRAASGPADSWATGDTVRSGTMTETLSSFAGVSHGVSVIVPGMLTEAIIGEVLTRSLRVDGEDQLGAERCVKLASSDAKGSMVVWVDKSTNALRRIVRDQAVTIPGDASKTYAVRDEIDYWPSFDQPIENARFVFAPPSE